MGDTDIHVGAKENVDNKNPPGPKDTGGRTGNNSKIRTFFLRNRLIFDGGFDGGFVNFWDGFYSYTIFYLLKSGLFMQKNNLTTYALAKNQGFNSPRLHHSLPRKVVYDKELYSDNF